MTVRVHSAHQSTRGAGLGLLNVREIRRAHRGEVTVRSASDQGTTFRAWFQSDGSAGAGAGASLALRCASVPALN